MRTCGICLSGLTYFTEDDALQFHQCYHKFQNFLQNFLLFLSLFSFWDGVSLTLSLRLKCSSAISVQWNICLPDSSHSPALASQVAGITGILHDGWPIFVFSVEMGLHHVSQAGFELLTSSDLPILVSQSARIKGVSHCTLPQFPYFYFLFFDTEFPSCCTGWMAMVQSWLTATSTSRVQVILLPQPPK